jgi:hypothetical protein
MARASLIQFSSGSHSSSDLQSVHARKHSAFAVALILAFVAKNPSYRIVQAEQTPPFVELCDGRARRQPWWVIKMRVCIKLITRVGYRCRQMLAIAAGVMRLGSTMPQKHSVLCGVDRFTTQPVPLFRAARLLALFLRVARGSSLTFNLRLIAEHHVQQGTVNFNVAVVINKTQFPEFVHEKTHARSRRADHLRKCLLADYSPHPSSREGHHSTAR